MRKYLVVVTICLQLFLVACASVPPTLPPYIVMLTNALPAIDARCTGAILDPTHVVTAAHCVKAVRRVVAPDGQEAWVIDVALADHDLAVLEINKPIYLPVYAELGMAHSGTGQVYGTCPYFWGHTPRHVVYGGMWSYEVEAGLWIDFDLWHTVGDTAAVCGGDSGGVVIQQGKVVGVTSVVESRYYFVAYGQTFLTVPSEIATDLLENGYQ